VASLTRFTALTNWVSVVPAWKVNTSAPFEPEIFTTRSASNTLLAPAFTPPESGLTTVPKSVGRNVLPAPEVTVALNAARLLIAVPT